MEDAGWAGLWGSEVACDDGMEGVDVRREMCAEEVCYGCAVAIVRVCACSISPLESLEM